MTAHLHRQNQVAHFLRTRDFWLASLSMYFPIHFARRAHEYPVTLTAHFCTAIQRIRKSFRHALHLVTAQLHRQNQVAHSLRTRDFWLASLSMHFPIHFGQRAHKYPVTLNQGRIEPPKAARGRKRHNPNRFYF